MSWKELVDKYFAELVLLTLVAGYTFCTAMFYIVANEKAAILFGGITTGTIQGLLVALKVKQ